jgi:hypothetical protein
MKEKTIYVDVDETICYYEGERKYDLALPIRENIDKINKLYDEGNFIMYWTARGSLTGIDWFDLTKKQLDSWGCSYNGLSVGEKPPYDLLICDKTKRIEEI